MFSFQRAQSPLSCITRNDVGTDAPQAEEERHAAAAAAEEAARQEAEAAQGDPAVAQMRRVLNKTKSGAKVADAMKQLEVEGGLAGKWKVLYEVSITLHAHLLHNLPLSFVSTPCNTPLSTHPLCNPLPPSDA